MKTMITLFAVLALSNVARAEEPANPCGGETTTDAPAADAPAGDAPAGDAPANPCGGEAPANPCGGEAPANPCAVETAAPPVTPPPGPAVGPCEHLKGKEMKQCVKAHKKNAPKGAPPMPPQAPTQPAQ